MVLCIAGSDCTAGAGIQADLKTCAALGVYAATAVTAVTAQNHRGLHAARYVGDVMLRAQLENVAECMDVAAVKIGMVPCAEAARVIGSFLASAAPRHVVFDPVLAATAGGSLTGDTDATADAALRHILPHVDVLTPNEKELYRLARRPATDPADATARAFAARYGLRALLVTGGDAGGDVCTDTLWLDDREAPVQYSMPRIDSLHTHGTGCTLSSAITACLALGLSVTDAVAQAKRFTARAIENGASHPVMSEYGPVKQSAMSVTE